MINFLADNYSWGNDFATIKIFDQKFFSQMFLVDNYSRGNEFAMIKKNVDQKFVPKISKWVTNLEEMILQR